MEFSQILILALIQALTEFLPVSSSAHLFLASEWFGWRYQGVTFDLGLHMGTLFAVVAYFRRDLAELVHAVLRYRPGQTLDAPQRLSVALVIATIPACIVALLFTENTTMLLRNAMTIGVLQIVFGLLMYLADKRFDADKPISALTWPQALTIGAAQALALMPGVSRSGVTMTMALFLGLGREAAARFSFLLAVPIVSLGALKGVYDVLRHDGSEALALGDFLLGASISAVLGYAVIALFLRVIGRIGVAPFMWYRVALGVFLIGGALWGGAY